MELWMPGAVIIKGVDSVTGYDAYGWGNEGPKRGDVKHSAEGWRTALRSIIVNGQKSWHFTVLTDGVIWQHFPIDRHCWHATDTDDDDGVKANLDLVGIEHEGVAGQELTAEQVQSTVEISRFCAEQYNRDSNYTRHPIYSADGWALVEHNEVGNTPTACPSDRIPWDLVLEGLGGDEEEELFQLVEEGNGTVWVMHLDAGGFPMSRKEAKDWDNPNGNTKTNLIKTHGPPSPAKPWLDSVPNLSKLL